MPSQTKRGKQNTRAGTEPTTPPLLTGSHHYYHRTPPARQYQVLRWIPSEHGPHSSTCGSENLTKNSKTERRCRPRHVHSRARQVSTSRSPSLGVLSFGKGSPRQEHLGNANARSPAGPTPWEPNPHESCPQRAAKLHFPSTERNPPADTQRRLTGSPAHGDRGELHAHLTGLPIALPRPEESHREPGYNT